MRASENTKLVVVVGEEDEVVEEGAMVGEGVDVEEEGSGRSFTEGPWRALVNVISNDTPGQAGVIHKTPSF